MENQRTITATIKGKMEKEGSRGAYLDVQIVREGKGGAPDGGRFPETFKCWDAKQLEHVPLNSSVRLILHCDGKKKDREDDGQESSYWWSISGVDGDAQEEADQYEASLPDSEPPSPAQQAYLTRLAHQREAPPPLPQALGACQNHAMAFVQAGIIPVPEGRDPINFLWELRDRIYRNVNQKPYQPEHFCYAHEQLLRQSKTGVWGHVLPDGTGCIEPSATGDAGADAKE